MFGKMRMSLSAKENKKQQKQERLAAALRENLRKRKQQQRVRADDEKVIGNTNKTIDESR